MFYCPQSCIVDAFSFSSSSDTYNSYETPTNHANFLLNFSSANGSFWLLCNLRKSWFEFLCRAKKVLLSFFIAEVAIKWKFQYLPSPLSERRFYNKRKWNERRGNLMLSHSIIVSWFIMKVDLIYESCLSQLCQISNSSDNLVAIHRKKQRAI
jgi:hypothetical protein